MLFRQCLIRYMQPQSQERLQTLQLFRWRSLTLSTKHHRRSLLKRLAVRRMLYQSILMESWPESKSAEGKRCTINRDDCSLKRTDVQGWFKNLGKLYKEWAEDCVSAWRARHTELLKGATTDAFLISSHTWTRDVRRVLPRLRRKRTGLLLSPKSLSCWSLCPYLIRSHISFPPPIFSLTSCFSNNKQ